MHENRGKTCCIIGNNPVVLPNVEQLEISLISYN